MKTIPTCLMHQAFKKKHLGDCSAIGTIEIMGALSIYHVDDVPFEVLSDTCEYAFLLTAVWAWFQ